MTKFTVEKVKFVGQTPTLNDGWVYRHVFVVHKSFGIGGILINFIG